jgi:HEAT repeat protein
LVGKQGINLQDKLIKFLDSDSEVIIVETIQALKSIGSKNENIANKIAELLNHKEHMVRFEAKLF